ELLAHQPHRAVDALPDQRLAALADDARERVREPRLAVRRDELAGEQQRPGRGVDEQRRALAEMLVPLAGADLVANQRVARRRIGDSKQRLGEAHQRDAFLRRQRILLQQPLDEPFSAAAARPLAQRLREAARELLRGARALGLEARRGEKRRHGIGLRPPRRRGDRLAQRRSRAAERDVVVVRHHCIAAAPRWTSIAAARSSSALPTDLKTVRSSSALRPRRCPRASSASVAIAPASRTPRAIGPIRSPLLVAASSLSTTIVAPAKQSSSASRSAGAKLPIRSRWLPARNHLPCTSGSRASVAQLTMSASATAFSTLAAVR